MEYFFENFYDIFRSMKILKINPFEPEKEILDKAVSALKEGLVIAHETDTCYGFAVDPFNEKVLQRLYLLKKSDFRKPVSLILGDKMMISQIALENDLSKKLTAQYWPGALTIVLKKRKNCPKFLNPNSDTIGIRMPNDKVCLELCSKFGGFLTSTSANISGKPQAYSVNDIEKQFRDESRKPDLLLDSGELPKRAPSTVVDVSSGEIKVIRQGEVKVI